MDPKVISFQRLANIFTKNSKNLYLVGGTVRDFLLNKPLTDLDCVTDATPDEMKEILKDYKFDDTFSRMGYIKLSFENDTFDITTLRQEKDYTDSRHPKSIIFVKNLDLDVVRRDFTINGMYLNDKLEIIDYIDGKYDLQHKVLRMIGDPMKRLKEDPLRICRAVRFSLTHNLIIDNELAEAIRQNSEELKKLNPEKIKQDLKKMASFSREDFIKICHDLSIEYLIDMID